MPIEKKTGEIKTPEKIVEVVEIPTQTGRFIKDNETGEVLQMDEAIAEILNEVKKIKKAVS